MTVHSHRARDRLHLDHAYIHKFCNSTTTGRNAKEGKWSTDFGAQKKNKYEQHGILAEAPPRAESNIRNTTHTTRFSSRLISSISSTRPNWPRILIYCDTVVPNCSRYSLGLDINASRQRETASLEASNASAV